MGRRLSENWGSTFSGSPNSSELRKRGYIRNLITGLVKEILGGSLEYSSFDTVASSSYPFDDRMLSVSPMPPNNMFIVS